MQQSQKWSAAHLHYQTYTDLKIVSGNVNLYPESQASPFILGMGMRSLGGMELGPAAVGGRVQTSMGAGRPSAVQERLASSSKMAVMLEEVRRTEGRTGGEKEEGRR